MASVSGFFLAQIRAYLEDLAISHITDLDQSITVKDLAALKMAVEKFCPDLEWVTGQKDYRTWKDDHNGQLVGDWPVPRGMTAEEIGHNAVHVIRMKEAALHGQRRNASGAPYEIGVVPHPEKKGEYVLMTDFWNQGNGILSAKGVGVENKSRGQKSTAFGELYMHYRMMEVAKEARRQGHRVEFQDQADGTVVGRVYT